MNTPGQPDNELERELSSRLLDALIRAAFIGVLASPCYVAFAPFLTLMVWAGVLAVALYPVHQSLVYSSRERNAPDPKR